jgi:O-antigen/teichoic acid export membrane protein
MISKLKAMILPPYNSSDENIAVRWSIAARIWGIIGSLVTIIFIYVYFTPDMQGYYYAFMSLIALQVFAELGFTTVILFHTRDVWANLISDDLTTSAENKHTYIQLLSIFKTALIYCFLATTMLVLILEIFGTIFLMRQSTNDVNWFLPWMLLCPLVGLNIVFSCSLAFLEGCNYLTCVYAARFYHAFANQCIIWVSIAVGGGLWALPLGAFAGLIMGILFSDLKGWHFILQKIRSTWSKSIPFIFYELWSMQWRIALSSISAFLTFSLAIPLSFNYIGPSLAGQLGLSLSISFAVVTVSGSILSPAMSRFASHVALAEHSELDKLFFKQVAISTVLSVFLASALMIFKLIIDHVFPEYSSRLLPTIDLLLLLSASVCQSVMAPILVYIRAHKKDPTYLVSIVFAFLIACAAFYFLQNNNLRGFTVSYFSLSLLCVPTWFYLWQLFRRKWH